MNMRTTREGGSEQVVVLSLSRVWHLSSSPMPSSDASVSLVRLSSSVPSMLLALNLSTNPWSPSSTSHSDTSPSDQSATSSFDRPAAAFPERASQGERGVSCWWLQHLLGKNKTKYSLLCFKLNRFSSLSFFLLIPHLHRVSSQTIL